MCSLINASDMPMPTSVFYKEGTYLAKPRSLAEIPTAATSCTVA